MRTPVDCCLSASSWRTLASSRSSLSSNTSSDCLSTFTTSAACCACRSGATRVNQPVRRRSRCGLPLARSLRELRGLVNRKKFIASSYKIKMPTHRLLANGRAPCLALLQTAERPSRVSLVDSWCLTNLSNRTPSPLENEPRRNLRENPTCEPSYNTSWGGSIGLRHGESYSETDDRSISGYAKDRGRGRGSSGPTKPDASSEWRSSS